MDVMTTTNNYNNDNNILRTVLQPEAELLLKGYLLIQ